MLGELLESCCLRNLAMDICVKARKKIAAAINQEEVLVGRSCKMLVSPANLSAVTPHHSFVTAGMPFPPRPIGPPGYTQHRLFECKAALALRIGEMKRKIFLQRLSTAID